MGFLSDKLSVEDVQLKGKDVFVRYIFIGTSVSIAI